MTKNFYEALYKYHSWEVGLKSYPGPEICRRKRHLITGEHIFFYEKDEGM